MLINRDALLNKLFQFSLQGSGIVVGKPGIGKSYLLKQLRKKLYENKTLSFLIKIDNTYDSTDEAITTELEFEENWIDTLKNIFLEKNKKAVLIFDSFDAARDEKLRKGFLGQIHRAKKELANKCNIIVSVRTYDASKSPELLRLFPLSTNAEGETLACRKEEVNELNEEEIIKAIRKNKGLLNFYKESNNELKEILKVPFFLVLLETIVNESTKTELEEIKKYKSETQLLKAFWQKKLVNINDHISKELFLLKFTYMLVNTRSLSLTKNSFLYQLSELPVETFNYLRSENIVDEVSINNTRLAFSHNILFDYAVSVFCLSENYKDLILFINSDPTRPFFLRPSFIYFFTSLWYEQRKSFWILYTRLLENPAKEIQLFVRLILNGIISSEYSNTNDLTPIISDATKDKNFIPVRNILQSIRFIRKYSNLQDIDLLLYLSEHLHPSFLFEFAFLLARSVDAIQDKESIEKCGKASRSMLKFILTTRNKENKHFLDRIGSSRGVELVSKTYNTDKEESKNTLSVILELLKEPEFEIYYFSNLSEYIKFILPHDREFVAEVYKVIFGYKETSDQTTHMGGSVIMSLKSNRRQDYELCYYRLEEFFPEFLQAAPSLGLEIGMKIVNDFIIRDKIETGGLKISSEIFKYNNSQCEYIVDLSSIWSENIHYYKQAEFADKIISYIDGLIVNNNKEYRNLIQAYIKNAKVGYTWKLLFKLGAKYPTELLKDLYPLIITPPLMKGPDTSFEVREFIEKACQSLNKKQIKKIEQTIFSTYNKSEKYTITSALSRIPIEKLQQKRSKDFMSKNEKIPNEPGFKSSFSIQNVTSEMWLEERGVNLSNPENEKLTNSINKLDTFNSKWLNGNPDINEYKEFLNVAQETYYGLANTGKEIHEDLLFSVLSSISKTLAIVSRNLKDISTEDFDFLKTATRYLFHFKSKYDIDNYEKSPSRGWSSTPRIEAAEAFLYLYVHENSEDNFQILEEAINDENGIVRYNAIKRLIQTADIRFDKYWPIIINRLTEEDDTFIYAILLDNLKFKPEKIKEQAVEVINIAYSKKSFFSWQNDFINNFTEVLLWLLRRHKLEEAREMLLSAYKKKHFCHAVIFKIFERLHPSFPENEFIEHPENYCDFLDIIDHYVSECGNLLRKIKPEDFQIENDDIKNSLEIIDEIITRIYFQFDSKTLGRANIKLPVNEENREAFYFMIKSTFKNIIQLSSEIVGTGLITGHTAHYFIQSLNKVLSYDAKDILSMITDITKYSAPTGYTFDSFSIREMVHLTEKLLADHRDLLLDDDSFKDLIDLLDIYINSGWVEALELLWKLDEVFK